MRAYAEKVRELYGPAWTAHGSGSPGGLSPERGLELASDHLRRFEDLQGDVGGDPSLAEGHGDLGFPIDDYLAVGRQRLDSHPHELRPVLE